MRPDGGAGILFWLTGIWITTKYISSAQVVNYSQVCPSVALRSLKPCSRCLTDDMCPYENGEYYICDGWLRKCVSPSTALNRTQIDLECPSNPAVASTWDAQCKQECTDTSAPFGCANQCLNLDFPCAWVDGCNPPTAMTLASSVCLRPCVDSGTDSLSIVGQDTCANAKKQYSCEGTGWASLVAEMCPVTCRTPACPSRCGREEVSPLSGLRCWIGIQQGLLDCATGIRLGLDCHCTCGSVYFLRSTQYNLQGGVFSTSFTVSGQSFALSRTGFQNYTANAPFSIDLPGEALTTKDLSTGTGPRLKIVHVGDSCGTALMPSTVSGLVCQKPAGADDTTVAFCTTPPSMATFFLHRWSGITIKECGKFTVCHCNTNCGLVRNWLIAGVIEVAPVQAVSATIQSMPGCMAFFPTNAPITGNPNKGVSSNETVVQESIQVSYSLAGGFPPLQRSFDLFAQTLRSQIEFYSPLLNQFVPTTKDLSVTWVPSTRRLRSGFAPERSVSASCSDNDALFASTLKDNGGLLLPSCASAIKALGASMICRSTDVRTQQAVQVGCQQSCGLCTVSQQGNATSGGSSQGQASTTSKVQFVSNASNDGSWPGGIFALHFRVTIQIRTDWSGDAIMQRLDEIGETPSNFVLAIFTALAASGSGFTPTDVTSLSQVWVYTASGPTLGSVPTQAPSGSAISTGISTTMIIAIVCAVAGACIVSGIAVFLWWALTRPGRRVRVMPTWNGGGTPGKVTETVKLSDAGYRLKKERKEEAGTNGEPDSPGWSAPKKLTFTRFLMSRLCPCFITEVKRLKIPAKGTFDDVEIAVGMQVRLVGLSQAQYNGLSGIVTSGPNDKGRFMVDVLVVDDDSTREFTALSLRPENLRPSPQTFGNFMFQNNQSSQNTEDNSPYRQPENGYR